MSCLTSTLIGNCDEKHANGLPCGGFGSCFAGDGDAVGGSGALADVLGHRLGDGVAGGGVFRDQIRRHAEEGRFHFVGVSQESALKVAGASGNGSDARCIHARGGAFRDSYGSVGIFESPACSLFERRTIPRIDAIA